MENLRAVMSRQVQQLIRLIDDLMDLARITNGKIQLRRSSIELETAITRAVEAARPMLDALGHKLTVSMSEERVLVNGDIARLTQVFSNVLNNAAKYTPHGGDISVSVATREGNAVVRIKDSGLGIPQHLLSSVFDAFC